MILLLEKTSATANRVRAFWGRAPWIPLTIILIFIFAAVAADLIMPHDPYVAVLEDMLMPPFWYPDGDLSHLLGTDAVGRDILSRIILGARVSLSAATAAILLGGGVGTALGLIAGYHGGLLDALIMRACDVMISFPAIILALIFAVMLGPSFGMLIFVIGFVLWARFARLVRGDVLTVKTSDYVSLAKVAGCSSFRIIVRHIFPNVVHSAIVMGTLQVGYAIMLEASLSFLGAGVPPPIPAWGSMVADGRVYVTSAWWLSVFPGLAVMFTVIAFNLFGDWLRDTLDPTLQEL